MPSELANQLNTAIALDQTEVDGGMEEQTEPLQVYNPANLNYEHEFLNMYTLWHKHKF